MSVLVNRRVVAQAVLAYLPFSVVQLLVVKLSVARAQSAAVRQVLRN